MAQCGKTWSAGSGKCQKIAQGTPARRLGVLAASQPCEEPKPRLAAPRLPCLDPLGALKEHEQCNAIALRTARKATKMSANVTRPVSSGRLETSKHDKKGRARPGGRWRRAIDLTQSATGRPADEASRRRPRDRGTPENPTERQPLRVRVSTDTLRSSNSRGTPSLARDSRRGSSREGWAAGNCKGPRHCSARSQRRSGRKWKMGKR